MAQIKNLLINLPLNTGKSLLAQVFFFCWRWVNNPCEWWLVASHNADLGERFSNRCRKVIESEEFQNCYPGLIELDPAQNQKDNFANLKGGYRETTTSNTGAGITGRKGDVLLLDDVHDASHAQSEVKREGVIKWFADVWWSRLRDFNTGQRIVIGQRIHKKDLSNFIINHYSSWEVLVLPWEYKPTQKVSVLGWKDPRTQPGEELWPERVPAKEVQDAKRRPWSFQSQWNQAPSDVESNVFYPGNFKYYDSTSDGGYKLQERKVAKDECFTIISCDPAISERGQDYTALVVAAVSAYGDIIITDVYREKLSAVRVVNRLQVADAKHKPAYILIESGGISTAVLQQARLVTSWHGNIRPVKTKRGATEIEEIKVVRSIDAQLAFEEGKIWFPLHAPWLAVLEQEIAEFPKGDNDDMVDSLGYLVTFARKRCRGRLPEEPEKTKERTPEEIAALWHKRIWED